MSYRIEALRVHIENQMGDVLFIQAYKHLTVSINSVKMTSYFAESLGWWRTARQLAGSFIEKEDEIELGGDEGDDEEKVDMVQILGKRGGVKTKISDCRIQQL